MSARCSTSCLCLCVCARVRVCLPVRPSVRPSLSRCLSACQPACLPVGLAFCLSVCLRLRLHLRLCPCLSMCLRPCVSVPASDCGISAKNTEENVLTTWVLAHIVLEVVNLSATQEGLHAAELCGSLLTKPHYKWCSKHEGVRVSLCLPTQLDKNLSEQLRNVKLPYLASLREPQALLKRTT